MVRYALVKKLLQEFKAFAAGGNMVDLAIGVILGIAFGKVVDSLANDVIGNFIAAVFGAPNLDGWVIHLRHGSIAIGTFAGQLLNFLIIAGVLFLVVKMLKAIGIGNFRAQGQRECPYCREFVAVDAIRCRHCTSDLQAVIDGDEGADERVAPA